MVDNTVSKHFVSLVNALNDNWTDLSHAEHRAMLYILNRTVRWNRWSESIPRRHIERGVPNIETGPAGMTYRHWLNCIRALREAGLIQTADAPGIGLLVEVIPQRVRKGPIGMK